MRATAAAIVLTVAGACASGPARQVHISPAASIDGTPAGLWILTSDGNQAYAQDWRRTPRQVVQPRFMEPPAPQPMASEDPAQANKQYVVERQAAQDRWAAANRARDASYFAIADGLHQTASAIEVDLKFDTVILTRDGGRLEFKTAGVKERFLSLSESVEIKTWLEGAALHQELTNRHGLKATLVYSTSADRGTMSVVTTVLSPSFRPPLETTRTYRRRD